MTTPQYLSDNKPPNACDNNPPTAEGLTGTHLSEELADVSDQSDLVEQSGQSRLAPDH